MKPSCEDCSLYRQCNDVYDRVAGQVSTSLTLSELYNSTEVRDYIQSTDQRVRLGLEDSDSLDAKKLRQFGRIGRSVNRFEDSQEERIEVLDNIAGIMEQILGSTAVCDGPVYGRIASWSIGKLESQGDEEGAKYFRKMYAKCSSPNMHDLHWELRKASSDIPGIN